ncbi:MAG: hypothetical protein HKN04_12670 [Rhodothermaceae bacterium]|nr:hypothetical protein [Rhodothermaceae bacterium]
MASDSTDTTDGVPSSVDSSRSDKAPRRKLGLALAGGGFRASLFHVGVLHRMAELDLLRRVEVLSTVSGGSIVGALYTLLLKREMLKRLAAGKERRLGREDYRAIASEVEERLVRGIERNPRNAAFKKPWHTFRMLVSPYSLSQHMARLYEQFLFKDIVEELWDLEHERVSKTTMAGPISEGIALWGRTGERPSDGRIPLREIRAVWSGERLPGGLEAYNAREAGDPAGCAVTHHVINATTVNSGGRFLFASNEVGDWYLGYARNSEARKLARAKEGFEVPLVETGLPFAGLARRFGRGRADAEHAPERAQWMPLVRWLEEPRTLGPNEDGGPWDAILRCEGVAALARADLGLLRRAKLPAWYLREGPKQQPAVGGGLSPEEHVELFLSALHEISSRMYTSLEAYLATAPAAIDHLVDFILRLYLLRSARGIAPEVERELGRLTLGTAVGASACFPPIFSPIMLEGLYDNAHVARLGLTDGGVFDNVGVSALLDERCTHIIASDTSGVFEQQLVARPSRLLLFGRLTIILMKVLGDHQRHMLRERRRAHRAVEARGLLQTLKSHFSTRMLRNLAFFHIESLPLRADGPSGWSVDRARIARLRTDLDAFGEIERNALINQGYVTADHYLREFLTDYNLRQGDETPEGAWWGFDPPALPKPPPGQEDGERWDRVLRFGSARFFRAVKLKAIVPLLLTGVFVALALLGLVWVGVHFDETLAWVGRAVAGLGRTLATISAWWAGWSLGWMAGVSLVLIAVLWILQGLWKPLLQRQIERWPPPWNRYLATAGKWFGLGWRVLWRTPFALVLALVLMGYAFVNDWLFQQPFLRASRVGKSPKGTAKQASDKS